MLQKIVAPAMRAQVGLAELAAHLDHLSDVAGAPTIADLLQPTVPLAQHPLFIADVRQGKYFEIALEPAADQEQARESVGRMAREVLSNPIIEDYRVEIEG